MPVFTTYSFSKFPKNCHFINREETIRMGYLCHICYKIYSSQFALDRHTTSAHLEHKHPCPRCSNLYCRKQELNAHALEEHGLKLIWKTAVTGSLVYARELVLLDEGGVLLQGPNPRYLFRHKDPQSIKLKTHTATPLGGARNQLNANNLPPEPTSNPTPPSAVTAGQLTHLDHRPLHTQPPRRGTTPPPKNTHHRTPQTDRSAPPKANQQNRTGYKRPSTWTPRHQATRWHTMNETARLALQKPDPTPQRHRTTPRHPVAPAKRSKDTPAENKPTTTSTSAPPTRAADQWAAMMAPVSNHERPLTPLPHMDKDIHVDLEISSSSDSSVM